MLRTPVLPETVIEIYMIYIYIPIWIGRIELVSCTVYSSTCHVVVSRMERSKWNAPPWLGGPKMQTWTMGAERCTAANVSTVNILYHTTHATTRYTEISTAHIQNASDTRSKYTLPKLEPFLVDWLEMFWVKHDRDKSTTRKHDRDELLHPKRNLGLPRVRNLCRNSHKLHCGSWSFPWFLDEFYLELMDKIQQ